MIAADTRTLPHITESWAWWTSWLKRHPDKLNGLNLRNAKPGDFERLGGGTCPYCGSKQVVKFSEPSAVGVYDLDRTLCACLITKLADLEHGEIESSWFPTKLNDIKPIANPDKKAETNTIAIRNTAGDFITHLGQWLFISGGYGSGKTHVLQAIKTSLRGLALYINAAELASHLYSAVGTHEVGELIEYISAQPVLLIDDLGVENGKEFLYSSLYAIINNRYAKRFYAPTVIASNLTQEQLKTHPDDNMRRIASRLADNRLVIPLVSTQADFRGLE